MLPYLKDQAGDCSRRPLRVHPPRESARNEHKKAPAGRMGRTPGLLLADCTGAEASSLPLKASLDRGSGPRRVSDNVAGKDYLLATGPELQPLQ